MLANATASSFPSSTSACGATWKPPPKTRAFATISMSRSLLPQRAPVRLPLERESPVRPQLSQRRSTGRGRSPRDERRSTSPRARPRRSRSPRCSGSACPRSFPTSIVRVTPSRTIRQQAATSRGGMPRVLARSQPVPPGTSPRLAGTPVRRMALPTLLQVPSPPTATMRRKPRRDRLLGEPRLVARPLGEPVLQALRRRQPLEDGGDELRPPALAGVRVEDDVDGLVHAGAGRGGLGAPATASPAGRTAGSRCASRAPGTGCRTPRRRPRPG